MQTLLLGTGVVELLGELLEGGTEVPVGVRNWGAWVPVVVELVRGRNGAGWGVLVPVVPLFYIFSSKSSIFV